MGSRSRWKRKSKSRRDKYGWCLGKRKQVPYQCMWGTARGSIQIGVLPSRIEAVFVEGLRDPGGLRPLRLLRWRKQEDVDYALTIYPEKVVRALYPANFKDHTVV